MKHLSLSVVPRLVSLATLAMTAAALPLSARAQASGSVGTSVDPAAAAREAYGKLPLSFEANHGQTAPSVQFLARGAGYSLFLTGNETVFVLRRGKGDPKSVNASQKSEVRNQKSTVLRMNLVGANKVPAAEGLEEQAGKANYFTGNDPAKWQTNVPTFSRVHYKSIYPGIDLTYYGNQRQLEYDFIVSPKADYKQIKLGFKDAKKIEIEQGSGDLLLHTRLGVMREHQPQVYQERDGGRRQIASRYVRRGAEIGFEVGDYDATLPLVIDPALSYSTYLGGSNDDRGYGIAVDSSRNAYVTGLTVSTNFPTKNPSQASMGGNGDAFVTKLNPAGDQLVYSTYLGGGGEDTGRGIAVDSSGNAYITGNTLSLNFPTKNPLQANFGGGSTVVGDAFVTKLSATGQLVYSTYLGGNAGDQGLGIAVVASGNAYVTGSTASINFPTKNPFQAGLNGTNNAFVTEINTNLSGAASLAYSSYLGGNGGDVGNTIAVDSSGNAYITGKTGSTNFPTLNPLQASYSGTVDAFVTKINPNTAGAASLVYSTYLGGNSFDIGNGIAVDSSGSAYIAGQTQSPNFPTQNPAQAVFGGSYDVFVTKLNATGNRLVYSTYLGGSTDDLGYGIAVDSFGNAYVTGLTASTNFPTLNPLQGIFSGGGGDAFVTKLSATGNPLAYSTYLGGTGVDLGYGIAVDSSGNAYVTGSTTSTNFPTQSPLQVSSGGNADAFIAKISDTPAVATPAGSNVTVTSGNASANFSQVTKAGTTTFTPIDPNSAGAPPSGFTIAPDGPAYDITTTATFTPPIEVCFTVSSVNDPTAFSMLRILHGENGVLVDRTSRQNFASRQICALVDSLSPFVLAMTDTPFKNPSQLLNISTRLRVLTGDNALIGGFIVTGSQPKKVLIRGLGPSIPVAGQLLQDPTLELFDGTNTSIGTNDNWKDTQEQEIRDTTVPPSNDLEAAIVRTLSQGNYTAVLRGKNNGVGVGLVEAYDLARTASSQLANISTRGFVDVGENVMIGGVIIGGGTSGSMAKVLVEAIGPSLTSAGISGALQDPTLELRDANGGLLAQNDNWKETQEQAIRATTIPPTDDREAAILQTLAVGNYTAIVRGKGDTTGIGLVALYNLQ